MIKLKLFSKTYIFTMGLISMIILTSHILIYLALPNVYVNNKQKEVDKIIEELIEKVKSEDEEMSFKLAKSFAQKYNIQVSLTLGEEKRSFQGLGKVDIYINQDIIKEDSLILPDINGVNIIENYENGSIGVIGDATINQYININNASIIKILEQ